MGTKKTNGQAAATDEAGVSIRPTDAVQMGLLDDFDGEVTDAKFVHFDYNGKSKAVMSIAVEIDPDEGEKFVQQYSCGEAAKRNFVILPGNTKVKPVNATVTGLPDGSNGVQFLASLVSAGFPLESMTDDLTSIVGTRAHFRRVANKGQIGQKEGERASSILLVERVLSLPGTQKSGKAKGTAKGATNGAPATNGTSTASSEPTDGIDDRAASFVFEQLSAHNGRVTKQELANTAFKSLTGDPDRNAIIAKVANDGYLGKAGQPWQYDGSAVTLG